MVNWLNGVSSVLNCETNLLNMAAKLRTATKDGETKDSWATIRSDNVEDFMCVFVGCKLGKPKKEVLKTVAKRRGNSTIQISAVQTALKALGTPEELLVPNEKKGKRTKMEKMISIEEAGQTIMDLFSDVIE